MNAMPISKGRYKNKNFQSALAIVREGTRMALSNTMHVRPSVRSRGILGSIDVGSFGLTGSRGPCTRIAAIIELGARVPV